MTTTNYSAIITKLKKLYGSNSHARAFLDHLSRRGKNPRGGFTSVEQAYAVLAEVDAIADLDDARQLLRQLANAGCGEFIVGRRGWPSRIDWSVNAIAAGRAARGEAVEVGEATGDETDDSPPAGMTDVIYPLRDDLPITLRLPNNLTEKEAERLARFITSLPK